MKLNNVNSLSRAVIVFVFAVSVKPAAAGIEETGIMCNNTIRLGQQYITAMKSIALQRVQNGDLNAQEYQSTIAQLEQQSSLLSLDQCLTSQGDQRVFYQCLNDQMGNIAACSN